MKLGIRNKIIAGMGLVAIMSICAVCIETVSLVGLKRSLGIGEGTGIIVSVIFCILILAVSAATIFLCLKNLKMHTDNLQKYSEKLSKGENDFTILQNVNDEFADVYKAFDKMLKNNNERALIAEKIAKGDLTAACEVYSSKDILGNALNDMINSNNGVLLGIKDSSAQMARGAEKVAFASAALSQGSTQQAGAIEQITVSMKDIEKKTTQNAEKVNEANVIVLNAKAGAQSGNTQMVQMKKAMDEINESSEKISKIIKVIDDISFQTNILALNAAVEAARAGSHGKGFAVVAEQIRELAGKSAAAATETAEIIDDSIHKVHNGNRLADETVDALNEIMVSIDKVVNITEGISTASNEQANAVTQINVAMEQVSEVVLNNSQTSKECAEAADGLSQQSETMRRMLDMYRLNENKGGSSVNPEDIISLDGDV